MPTIQDRFVMRRGLAANLASVNEVPLQGEWILALDATDDAHRLKVGDGTTRYNDLPYLAIGSGGGGSGLLAQPSGAFPAAGAQPIIAPVTYLLATVGGVDYLIPAFTVSSNSDPYYDHVIMLLPFTGANGAQTFADAKSGALWTPSGSNVILSDAQSPFGGVSLKLDGAGYLSRTIDSFEDVGGGAMTVEAFIYVTVAATNTLIVWNNGTSANVRLWTQSDGSIVVNYSTNGSVVTSASAVPLNQWLHVAATYDSLGTMRIFVNGVQKLSTATPAPSYGSNRVDIGQNTQNSGWRFNGYISNLRVTKGIARYVANFAPPAAPFA